MSVSKEERERLHELSQASPQKWSVKYTYDDPVVVDEDDEIIASVTHAYPEGAIGISEDDAELMAAARNALPRLLDALDEADSEKAELQRENKHLKQSLANIIVSNEPPTQADIDRAHELVERGDIED